MHGSETGTEGAPSEDSSALKSIDTDKLKQSHIAEVRTQWVGFQRILNTS